MKPILYWDRGKGREETEQVYGEAAVHWAYSSSLGRFLSDRFLSRKLVSELYGSYQSSALSRSKIGPFIRKFGIAMEEYEPGPFLSFNDFFTRRFRPSAREFETDPARLPAFCEARYLAFDRVDSDRRFPVKGEYLSARALLADAPCWKSFEGGPMLIARLCPTDYHRFHFPDDGKTLERRIIHGGLHSVNPAALRARGDIFTTNERQLSVLETKNFGKLAYIEVGAMCVGKIIQSHGLSDFRRGDEKGYFLFGASTVIVLGEPGKWLPDADLIEQAAQERETFVKLGSAIAHTV